MKFEKPFHIKIQPYYSINEPSDLDEVASMGEVSKSFGGLDLHFLNYEDELDPDSKIYRSGGRMDWRLYNENESQKPEINVHLMRLWVLQMVTQMVNEKAFVNEIHSEPKFHINEEDKKTFLNIIVKMTNNLHTELEKETESIIRMKKYKFNFD